MPEMVSTSSTDEGGSTGIVNEVTLGEDVYSFSNQDEVPPARGSSPFDCSSV